MKSFERRIQKLEGRFKINEEEKVIIILHKHFSTKYAKLHVSECSYGEGKNCTLYEEKYKNAKKDNPSNPIMVVLPCFKEDECPLCLNYFPTPTSGRDESNKNKKPKNKERSFPNKNDAPFKKIKIISEDDK